MRGHRKREYEPVSGGPASLGLVAQDGIDLPFAMGLLLVFRFPLVRSSKPPLFMGSRTLETPAMALRRMRARFQKLIKNSNSAISRRPPADERRKFSLPLWLSSQCEAAF